MQVLSHNPSNRSIVICASYLCAITNGSNAYTPYAFPSYVCAVASVEAFINEQLVGHIARVVLRDSPLWNLGSDSLEKMELLTKIIVFPQVLFGRSFRKNEQPFQDFAMLVRVRNDVIHFKMSMDAPSYLCALADRGIALTAPSASKGADYDWPHRLSSTEGICWAHNVACRIVNSLVQFVPPEHQRILGVTVQNYGEIGEAELHEWVNKACQARSQHG